MKWILRLAETTDRCILTLKLHQETIMRDWSRHSSRRRKVTSLAWRIWHMMATAIRGSRISWRARKCSDLRVPVHSFNRGTHNPSSWRDATYSLLVLSSKRKLTIFVSISKSHMCLMNSAWKMRPSRTKHLSQSQSEFSSLPKQQKVKSWFHD